MLRERRRRRRVSRRCRASDGLPALVEQFRSAGADVTLTVDGDIGGLPATTGLAVYRIAQEALTNAAKHAPGRRPRSG